MGGLRNEHKFRVSEGQFRLMRTRMRHLLRSDRHSDRRNEYHIRSLYFDDAQSSAFFDKLAGVSERKKYRIRIYNHSDRVIHLERKSKSGQFTHKTRAALSRREAEGLIRGRLQVLWGREDSFLGEFYLDARMGALRPVVIVDYVREAYTYPLGNVRITFDKKLSAGFDMGRFFDDRMITVGAMDGPEMIMEVKYDEFIPGFVLDLLSPTVPQRMAISKFAICRRLVGRNQWEDL